MYNLISQWQESGLDQKTFCEVHKIVYSTFKYYLKIKSSECHSGLSTPSFMSVKVTKHNELGIMSIIYPNGVRLNIDNTTSAEQLKTLIHLY